MLFARAVDAVFMMFAHAQLTRVEQVDCQISNEGAKFLAETLKAHTSLLKLILVRHCVIFLCYVASFMLFARAADVGGVESQPNQQRRCKVSCGSAESQHKPDLVGSCESIVFLHMVVTAASTRFPVVCTRSADARAAAIQPSR